MCGPGRLISHRGSGLRREADEVGGVVVADKAPHVVLDELQLGDRRVERLHLEAAGAWRLQRQTQRRIDDTTVAGDDHSSVGVFVDGSANRLTDPELKRGDRLAAREADRERVALPPT